MLTCDVALKQYFDEHVSKRAVAWQRTRSAIIALNRHFKNVPISEVDIPMCYDYSDTRGVADATVRRELGVLQAAANHAVKWRRLTAAQVPSIELPPENSKAPVWLFKDELVKLLDTAEVMDQKVFRFIQLAYHTASRKGAIERLEWSQVDEKSRRIALAKPREQKTKKRRPTVAISETMAAELASMRAVAENEWVLGSPYIVRRQFAKVAQAAGLLNLPHRELREAGVLTPHALRHSRATHLLQDGKDPYGVAALLGDRLPTVLRVYAHVCPDYLQGIVS
jgi:integrase